MKRILLNITTIFIFSLVACNNQNKSKSEVQKTDLNQKQTTNDMNSFISLFEIPATDLSRAVSFYQAILEINIEEMKIPGMEMGIFPYKNQAVTGVIVKGEGYKPSSNGVTIYLNGGNNLQTILDKVEKNGGKIIVPKTAHADESGFFALFLDTEGNKLGLNSPN
ncbi:VOC family protein [Wenyingzhuangia sp. 2_MG-2023]|uniref:VOC family protein n=1 Tax=Wenyingzhuangia sp. 2_MG-2023 TaxID=3062639 RepID=UPI0026E48C89|nr:VOC family protein [Wenyingzhuangia sp. 2_MG-2023]MDO6738960.1 VOC family protein [Wenyingzhuangia sp. 2_MG-2023]